MTYRHPARVIPYDELRAELLKARADGLVSMNRHPSLPLEIWSYTQRCVFERAWTRATLLARGLITTPDAVVATPFPKFFNYGERSDTTIPNESPVVTEKLDGSLGVVFYYAGKWHVSTRGSFVSEQAKWAQEWLDTYYPGGRSGDRELTPGCTYCVEIIYPQNRIVVPYGWGGLALLATYEEDGREVDSIGEGVFRADARQGQPPTSVASLLDAAKALKADHEGFVAHWPSTGLRLKIKGDEYCRIHALISKVTPLAVWEMLVAKDDIAAAREQLPEEFRVDFDRIHKIEYEMERELSLELGSLVAKAAALSDKELGLALAAGEFQGRTRHLIFPLRKHAWSDKVRRGLWEIVRPTGNKLSGYEPSSAVHRFEGGI